jgi:hypothetical protein
VKRALVVPGVVAALAAAAAGAWLARHPALPPAPTAQELAALEARRDRLQRELDALIEQDDQGLGRAPEAGVLVGIPTRLTSSIIVQIVTGLFGETTLTLRDLKVALSKEVRARVLLGERTLGRLDLRADIHEIHAALRPGAPEIAFGDRRVALTLPVRAVEGSGRATLHVRWNSTGLAGVVCGDLDEHVQVSVVPADYRLGGTFLLATQGHDLVLTPDFDHLDVRLVLKPGDETWKFVDQVVAGRGAVCRAALERLDPRAQIEKLLAKGFKARIPKKIFKPVRLPAGLQRSLELQGVRLTLQVVPTGLSIDDDRIWYGAEVRAARSASPPRPAGAASPVPAPAPSPPPS